MEEYEVDLRDYLKVIWQRKWVILGVFAAAILIAAILSFRSPDEYEASAVVQLATPPLTDLQLPLPQTVLELIKMNQPAGLALKANISGDSRALSLDVKGSLPIPISLQLRGPLPPSQLDERLSQLIAKAQAVLRDQIREDIQQKLAALDGQYEFFSQQRKRLLEGVQRWISKKQEGLRQQREALIKRLQEVPPQRSQGSLIQGLVLYELANIEDKLMSLEMERDSTLPQPGSGLDEPLLEVDRSLRQLELTKAQYQHILDIGWAPLRVLREPKGAPEPVGPSRTLNMAIAGVLGIFMGTLLAFFVNYLQPSEPAQLKREPSPK